MGVCAAYGHVSGPRAPVDIVRISAATARSSSRVLRSCVTSPSGRASNGPRAIAGGVVTASIEREKAVEANHAIESRKTQGATVLMTASPTEASGYANGKVEHLYLIRRLFPSRSTGGPCS